MTIEYLITVTLFALAGSGTPGPNNLMVMSNSAQYGYYRSLPIIFGICVGFVAMIAAMGLGLGVMLKASPMLYQILKYAAASYLIYLAWQIANSGKAKAANPKSKPFSFTKGAIFQLVNPKAWAVAMAAVTTYGLPQNHSASILILMAIFTVVSIFTLSIWAGFGMLVQRFLSDPLRLRMFNITMAVLLVGCLWPILQADKL